MTQHQPKTLVVIDGDAWGPRAQTKVSILKRRYPSLVVVAGADWKFLGTCDLGQHSSWFEPDTGWGVRILGADAMHFARADAADARREIDDAIGARLGVPVLSVLTDSDPPIVKSGPYYARDELYSGRADRVFYLCSPSRLEDRRRAFAHVTNGHMITTYPTSPAARAT